MNEETDTKRTMKIVVMVDTSGSMSVGGRMESLGAMMEDVIPELRDAQAAHDFADLQIQVIDFSTEARWVKAESQSINDFSWTPLTATGFTNLGAAIELLTGALAPDEMGPNCLPPVIILITDGAPTDDWESKLNILNATDWGGRGRSTRVGIAIGGDADRDVLAKFTGSPQAVFQGNNAVQLVSLIQWADDAVVDDSW